MPRTLEEKKAARQETLLKQHRKRLSLKQQGRCILCGAEAVTKNHCQECREWVNDMNRRNREPLRVCPHCGRELPRRRPAVEVPPPERIPTHDEAHHTDSAAEG